MEAPFLGSIFGEDLPGSLCLDEDPLMCLLNDPDELAALLDAPSCELGPQLLAQAAPPSVSPAPAEPSPQPPASTSQPVALARRAAVRRGPRGSPPPLVPAQAPAVRTVTTSQAASPTSADGTHAVAVCSSAAPATTTAPVCQGPEVAWKSPAALAAAAAAAMIAAQAAAVVPVAMPPVKHVSPVSSSGGSGGSQFKLNSNDSDSDSDSDAGGADPMPGDLPKINKRKAPEVDWRSITDPAERRRQRRLAKNRITAARSRERKKVQWSEMEAHLQALRDENSSLRAMLESVTRDNQALREHICSLETSGATPSQSSKPSRRVIQKSTEPAVFVILAILLCSLITLPGEQAALLVSSSVPLLTMLLLLTSSSRASVSGQPECAQQQPTLTELLMELLASLQLLLRRSPRRLRRSVHNALYGCHRLGSFATRALLRSVAAGVAEHPASSPQEAASQQQHQPPAPMEVDSGCTIAVKAEAATSHCSTGPVAVKRDVCSLPPLHHTVGASCAVLQALAGPQPFGMDLRSLASMVR